MQELIVVEVFHIPNFDNISFIFMSYTYLPNGINETVVTDSNHATFRIFFRFVCSKVIIKCR